MLCTDTVLYSVTSSVTFDQNVVAKLLVVMVMTILVAAPNAAFESKTVVGKSEFIITFMHLADTFIQRYSHCIQGLHSIMYSLGTEPMSLALLALCFAG